MSPPAPTSSSSFQVKRLAVLLFAVASLLWALFFLAAFIISWINDDILFRLTAKTTQLRVLYLIYYTVYFLVHFIGIFAGHTQRRDAVTFYDVLIFLIFTFTATRIVIEEVNFWLILSVIWNFIGLTIITCYRHHLKHIESQYETQP